jgi:glycosyltransferase involved in cell wall biosynthesis
MITSIIPALNDAERLTATLAALAPAAMDGFVRQVIVVDGGSNDETRAVAEEAGADVVATGFAAAIATVRQPWVLILAAGGRPQIGWERAAQAHMRDYSDKAGWFDLALASPGIGARVREGLARFEGGALGRFRLETGPLIKGQRLRELGPIKDYPDVIRRLRGARSRRLGVRILLYPA